MEKIDKVKLVAVQFIIHGPGDMEMTGKLTGMANQSSVRSGWKLARVLLRV